MGVAEKLQNIAEDVAIIYDIIEDLRLAIVAQEVDLPEGSPLADYPIAVAAIESGGGGSSTVSNGVKITFIDYDGTILKIEMVPSGGNATPPANPTGDDILTFLGWLGTYQNVQMDEIVGAKYWFGSGADLKSYLFINLDATTGLIINLRLYMTSGVATINWGDSTTSVTSGTGDKITAHTFPAYGSYRISIDGLQSAAGNELGGRGSNTYCIIDVSRALVKAYIGWPTVLGRYCFRDMRMLRSVCLSFIGSSTGIGNLQGFYQTFALKAMVIPSTYRLYALSDGSFYNAGIRYFVMPSGYMSGYFIGQNSFYGCNAIERIKVPSMGLAGQSVFSNCMGLKFAYFEDVPASENKQFSVTFYGSGNLESVRLPQNINDIFGQTFYNCFSLKNLDFPTTVTNFGTNIIDYCWSLKTVIIRATTPPTVSGTNPLSAVARIPVDLKYYVPDASVNAYKAATGWNTVADRIFPISSI